jgi:2-oxoacid:acceptor oxidoreductase delta subunit (pyruvate/2-ketoisovalerate family)
MIEVRFHGRGGQGAKIASRLLGRGGFLAGLYAQDFALFGAALRKTGNWRTERPVIDLAKCKRCFLCYLYCPEATMRLDTENFPHVDYDHCKGCMICYEECPTDAIARRQEA